MPVVKKANYTTRLIDLSESTTVAHAPTTRTVSLTPPAGKIWEIIDIYYMAAAPIGASSGDHRISIRYQGVGEVKCYCESVFGSFVSMRWCAFYGNSEIPSTAQTQLDLMTLGILIASNNVPLDFEYYNTTDVDKTGTRTLEIVVKEYAEGV